MIEIDLPSKSKLKIHAAPFAESRDLYQAFLEEAKVLKFDAKTDIDVNFFKDIFCTALSSKKIEKCVWKCLERATVDGVKITQDYFEPIEKRDDYLTVMIEASKVNIMPFTKSLYAQYSQIFESLKTVSPA